jgi:peptidase E
VTRPRQILALGGGGFSMEPTPLLDDAVLAAAGVDCPRVLFLPTASGDAAEYVVRFHNAFARKAHGRHLALFRRTVDDLRAHVLEHDIVYVGGGNTASMLPVWRAHGLDAVLREAYERGVVLAGLSAGAVCWFEGAITDSFGPRFQPLHDGLRLLPGYFVPHWDSEAARRPVLHELITRGDIPWAWAADDGAAVCFRDGAFHEVITSRPSARAYRVETERGAITERMLDARYLG